MSDSLETVIGLSTIITDLRQRVKRNDLMNETAIKASKMLFELQSNQAKVLETLIKDLVGKIVKSDSEIWLDNLTDDQKGLLKCLGCMEFSKKDADKDLTEVLEELNGETIEFENEKQMGHFLIILGADVFKNDFTKTLRIKINADFTISPVIPKVTSAISYSMACERIGADPVEGG